MGTEMTLMELAENVRLKAAAFEWLETYLDDLTVIRDVSKGERYQLSFCSGTSCSVDVEGVTLMDVINAARQIQEEE